MSYSFATQRANIFTENGQRMLLEIRDKALSLLEQAGAVRMEKLLVAGDSWDALACVDYLVERHELLEVTKGMDVAGQHRVFVKGAKWAK
jgi:hypothetical protein